MAIAGDVQALQSALAYEHSAVYGYGVLGSRLRGGPQTTARACWDGHKARRDRLTELLDARGAKPVAAEPAYRLPVQPSSPRAAAQLAVALETDLIGAYVALAGAVDPALRVFAAQAMQDAMVRQVHWGGPGPASAFPGLTAASLAPKSQ